MKNITCPISAEKVQAHIPRIVASLISISLLGFIITGQYAFVIIAFIDFLARSIKKDKYSLFIKLAKLISNSFQLKSYNIDKAPKIFASRLGLVFTSLIILLNVIGYMQFSFYISGILVLFASLECILNLCVGCYLYSWFLLPFYKNQ